MSPRTIKNRCSKNKERGITQTTFNYSGIGDRLSLNKLSMDKLDLKTFRRDLFFKYIPAAGCVSYGGFSMNITSPVQFSRMFGSKNFVISHCLWLNAHLGVGLYIYKRKHIQSLDMQNRIWFTVFASCIFNFGSVLLWAVSKLIFPEKLRPIFGIVSGAGLLYTGKKYLDVIDSQV